MTSLQTLIVRSQAIPTVMKGRYPVMCDVCCEHLLLPLVNKEVALAYSRAEYSQAGRDIYIERIDGEKEIQCRCGRRKMPEQKLTNKPQPCGEINRNGLICKNYLIKILS